VGDLVYALGVFWLSLLIAGVVFLVAYQHDQS